MQHMQLKMAINQHGGAQVELVKVLREEGMHIEHSLRVKLLDLAQNINEPFEVFMCRTDPYEVYLHIRLRVCIN